LSILFIPLTPSGILSVIALSIYPLVTSIIAIDPIFYLLGKVEGYNIQKNNKRIRASY
jgi:hypothetical protein